MAGGGIKWGPQGSTGFDNRGQAHNCRERSGISTSLHRYQLEASGHRLLMLQVAATTNIDLIMYTIKLPFPSLDLHRNRLTRLLLAATKLPGTAEHRATIRSLLVEKFPVQSHSRFHEAKFFRPLRMAVWQGLDRQG